MTVHPRRVLVQVTLAIVCVLIAANLKEPAFGEQPSDREAQEAVAVAPAVDSRLDRVSAMTTAQAQEARVEDESARTPTSATYANPDGTWTTEAYAGVVRSKSSVETWVPIDPKVESDGRFWRPKAVPFKAAYSRGGDRTIGSVTTAEESTVTVGWPTRLPAPEVASDQLTYPNVARDADLVVHSLPFGFSYSVVLHRAPAAEDPPVEYRIPLTFDGASTHAKRDGTIVIKKGKHRVATMTAPVMWDSEDASSQEPTQGVSATVEGQGNSLTLVLSPDMSFLRDPETVYPVTVDPTLALNVAGDTWVESVGATTSQHASPELRVGSVNLGITKARSFLYFDFSAVSSAPGAVLSSAELRLTNFQTGSCSGSALRMTRITGAWTVPGLTWANQPAVTTSGSSTSSGAFGAASCPGEGIVSLDAKPILTDWLGGAWNGGVRIKAESESAASGYRKFRSLENGDLSKVPQLVMTYNSYPAKPTGLIVSPGYPGYASSTTPTLTATVSDPDGGQVRGFFEVYSGNAIVWSGSSAIATSGVPVSVSVPGGVLSEGSTYTVAAYSQDASLKSKSAALKTMKVDTTAPSVAINATAFTNGTWAVTVPGSNTFTLDGPTDTATFSGVLDGVPINMPTNGAGDFIFPWVPTSGWHTVEAVAIDKAGNRGPASSFGFGVGPPGFTTPYPNARSTAEFPVQVTAPAGATGASLWWRLNEETTWRSATEVTSAGAAWTGTVSDQAGSSTTGKLRWTASSEALGAGTLDAPAVVQLRGCFQYASSSDKCTPAQTLQLTQSGYGGALPVAQLGPAAVALSTGEASIGATDAGSTNLGFARNYASYGTATLESGLFGPGWTDPWLLSFSPDTQAQVVDNRSKDGSFVIVFPDDGTQTFVPVDGSSTAFEPIVATGDSTSLNLTGGPPEVLELSRPMGAEVTTTRWVLADSDTGEDPKWVIDSVDAPQAENDLQVNSDHQRPTWIRESSPSSAATCTPSIQTTGCRALAITYAGTGPDTRVASVVRQIGAATQAEVSEKTLSTYHYDSAGRLEQVCTGAPAPGSPPLCESYEYTTVGGRTLLSQLAPPGQEPWRFGYALDGALSWVKRENPGGGDSTWSVDYDLPLNTAGLPDLSSSAAAEWGQTTTPSRAFAVYPPTTGTPDVTNAELFYTTADGTTTNTAVHGPTGWLVDTLWFDERGNVVQRLDGAGWQRVQAAAPTDRPRTAMEASSFTVYNAYGDADTIGTRVVDEYGPAHTASLINGTQGLARTHTSTMYDDDPDAPAALIANRPGTTGLGLVVQTIRSVSDVARTADYDSAITRFGYDPIVAGDANGWNMGTPTTTSTQVDSGSWSTATVRYDTSGWEIESRQPGGAADSSGAGSDALSTVRTFYSANGAGDCGGKPEWAGLICKTGPAGQPTGPTMPITFTSNYNEDLQPTTVQEISGGIVTRTVTTTYDNLGRVSAVVKATAGPGVSNDSIANSIAYDDESGLPVTVSSSGQTITTGYDTWGRSASYTDAYGMTSTTSYDAAGQVSSISDGADTYTYEYDARNFLTNVNAGGGVGLFEYSFNAGGEVETVTYPNGMLAEQTYNEVGIPTGLIYRSAGGTPLLAFSQTTDAYGRILQQSSPASAQQYGYDLLGRLVSVQDARQGACTTRTYGYNASSNRVSMTTFAPDSSTLNCQTSTSAVSKTATFDSAGRNRNTGYSYDTLGRTLTVPQADAGPNAAGASTMSYHANSMVAALTELIPVGGGGTSSVTMEYALDPAERVNRITTLTNGIETERARYHFAGVTDSASLIESSDDGGATWQVTRYIVVPGAGMVASQESGVTTLHLADLGGHVVATAESIGGYNAVDTYAESDEFGNDLNSSPRRYAWHGASQRSKDATGNMILMGVRVYNPAVGAFLTPDPVLGGNLTNYGYPEDPVGAADLTGMTSGCDDNDGCDEMWDACRHYVNYFRCKYIFYVLQHILRYSTSASSNFNYQNAGRHFAMVVIVAVYEDHHVAMAIARAHETGSTNYVDSRRDTLNNNYAYGWYTRHVSFAHDFVGSAVTTGDGENLFWHGVSLFQRGYMYGVCRIRNFNRWIDVVHKGPC